MNTALPAHANRYAGTYENFRKQTEDHCLRVLRDDGLYRHLRVQAPGTRIWSWDVITWPGHLATVGDVADGYTFTRELDMIDFFSFAGRGGSRFPDGAPVIDVRYWAEKLCGGRSQEVRRFSPDLFLAFVEQRVLEHEDFCDEAQRRYERQIALLTKLHGLRGEGADAMRAHLDEYRFCLDRIASTEAHSQSLLGSKYRDELHAAEHRLWGAEKLTDEQFDLLHDEFHWEELGDTEIPEVSPAEGRGSILDDARQHSEDESLAYQWMQGHPEVFGDDPWERGDFRDFDVHFVFACYCIDLTMRFYQEHLARRSEAL